jgi:hypothetical protein
MKSLAPILVSLLLLGAAGGQGPTPTRPGPRISVPETTWDFGTVSQFSVLEHAFLIRNAGDAVLTIKQVIPSCQCQAAMPKKNQLAPGEETSIETQINTQGLRGVVTKTVTVVSDDPTTPSVIITVKGEVLPPLSVKPAQIELGAVSKVQGSGKGEIVLTIARGMDVQLRDVKTSSPLIVVEPRGGLEQAADGTRSLRFLVSLAPGASVGLLRETVSFVTDQSTVPPAVVPITASVEGEVLVAPKTFNLGKVPQGEVATKEILVTKAGLADLEILGVDVNPPQPFEAEVIPEEAGRRYRIRVSTKADAPPGYQKGTLTIRTNCAGETSIQAYFYALVGR